jgi:hypothetical protein
MEDYKHQHSVICNRLTVKIGRSTMFKGQTVLPVPCEYLRWIVFKINKPT